VGPAAPAPVGREKMRDEVMDQLRAMRMWRITQELKLDEATAAKVFPLLARFDTQERELGRERGEAVHELRQLGESGSSDNARLNGLIDKLMANRTRRNQLEHEKLTALRRVLTPLQTAKLLMVLPRVEDGFRQKIREAMRRGEEGGPEEHRGGRGRGPADRF
jgi:Spy/CpxP family protein refolding chaperone